MFCENLVFIRQQLGKQDLRLNTNISNHKVVQRSAKTYHLPSLSLSAFYRAFRERSG